jgi:hypothetical protein
MIRCDWIEKKNASWREKKIVLAEWKLEHKYH